MYKKSITHHIAKVVIDILFYLSILCTLAIPSATAMLLRVRTLHSSASIAYATILTFSGACCVYILFHLKQMYKSLLVGNPFVDENVSHLRKMAVTCFIIGITYVFKSVFLFTIATPIIAGIFLVGCLFCLTLKDLFKQAINYKNENDLTI